LPATVDEPSVGADAHSADVIVPHREDLIVAIIQCDIRRGRSDEQKRRLAAGLTRVVSEVSGESTEQMFLVIRELPGFHFVDAGEHVADYVPGANGVDVAGMAQLRDRGITTD
jgi:4-oxalocrotonate tautomerase family enzyme